MIMGKTRRNCGGSKKRTRKYLGGVNNTNPLLGKSMTIKLFFDNDGLYLDEPVVSKKPEKKTATSTKVIKGDTTQDIKSAINVFLAKPENTDIDKNVAEFYVPDNIVKATSSNISAAFDKAIGIFTAEKDRKTGIGIRTTDGDPNYQKYIDVLTSMRNAIGTNIDAEYNNGIYPIFLKDLSKRTDDIKNLIANLNQIRGPSRMENGVFISKYKIDVFEDAAISGFLVSLFKSPYDDKRVIKSGFSSKYKSSP